MQRATAIKWIARVLVSLALVGAAGTWWTWHVIDQGQQQLRASRALAAAGKIRPAIMSARRAASWYAPGAPHVRLAYQRLIDLARLAESHGDRSTALFAWRSLRSAAMTSRSWTVPHSAEVHAADLAIARLASETPPPIGAPLQEPARLKQSILLAYEQPLPTRRPWVVAMLVSAAVSCVGLLLMARKGLAGNRLQRRAMVRSLAVFAAGLAGWLLACWMA